MTEKHTVSPENAATFAKWIAERGGLFIWESINLSNPGASWTTPATNEDGTPKTKPTWQAANTPARHITSLEEVDVVIAKEVKRFHVAVRMGGSGLMLKLTDASSARVRREVEKAAEKHGKPAWYEFDYLVQDAVIYVEGSRYPLSDWVKRLQPV